MLYNMLYIHVYNKSVNDLLRSKMLYNKKLCYIAHPNLPDASLWNSESKKPRLVFQCCPLMF